MINLLPPEIKKQAQIKSRVYGVFLLYFSALVAIGLIAVGLFTYNLHVGMEISDKQGTLDGLISQKKQASKLADKIAFIEDRVTVSGQFTEKIQWETFLDTLAKDTPVNVQLTTIKISADKAKPTGLTVSGQTTDRRAIILMKEKLAAQTTLSGVGITAMTEAVGSDNKKVFSFTIDMGVSNARSQ